VAKGLLFFGQNLVKPGKGRSFDGAWRKGAPCAAQDDNGIFQKSGFPDVLAFVFERFADMADEARMRGSVDAEIFTGG
jgi:hypothetical protein